jgi:MerR family redox-sensitive transcriptional activator SoxR
MSATLGLEVRFKSSDFSFYMANITIGEVARRTGLRASAIRYYEKIGLLPKTQRISGQRRYERDVFNYLAVIDVSRRAGFRMDEIKHLFHGFGGGIPAFRRWQTLAQRKITEMDDLIGRAKKMKRLLEKADRCKCLDLEDCGKAFLARSRTGERGQRTEIKGQRRCEHFRFAKNVARP